MSEDTLEGLVACLGEVVIDINPKHWGDPKRTYKIGGSPANVAAAIAARKARVGSAFIGGVGDDYFNEVMDYLREQGIGYLDDLSRFKVKGDKRKVRRSELEYIQLYGLCREPRFIKLDSTEAADTQLTYKMLPQEVLSRCDALHFGSLSLSAEPVYSALKEAIRLSGETTEHRDHPALISFDLCVREVVWTEKGIDASLARYKELLRNLRDIYKQAHIVKFTEREINSGLYDHLNKFRTLAKEAKQIKMRVGAKASNERSLPLMMDRVDHERTIRNRPEPRRILRMKGSLERFRELYCKNEGGVRLVVVTCGRDGCLWMLMKPKESAPAFKFVRQKYLPDPGGDGLGVGDAFISALLCELIQQSILRPEDIDDLSDAELDRICDNANQAGSDCASHQGCIMTPRMDRGL